MNIEFVTDNPLAMNYPPIPAKKMIPDWYKNVNENCLSDDLIMDAKFLSENRIETYKTIKSCVPVLDYLTSGYIIRSHSQILLTPKMINEDTKNFWWKSSDTRLDSHIHNQCPVSIDGIKNVYMKYMNSWKVKVPRGYSCLFYQPKFFLEDRYVLFPSIVDCDTFDSYVHFPGYVKTDKSFYINPGDPIMIVFPFKREDWKSDVRLELEDNRRSLSKLNHFLYDRYKKLFHVRKSYK